MVNTTDILPNTPRYLKVPLIVFNVILWIFGIILIALGGVSLHKLKELEGLEDITLPTGLIVLGVFFLILSVVGCVVAYKEKLVGLIFYTIFILVLLVCLIGVGGAAFTNRQNAANPLETGWVHVSNGVRVSIQNYFSCCGWELSNGQPTLYGNDADQPHPICTYYPNATDHTIFEPLGNSTLPGCKQTVVSYVQDNLYLAGVAGVVIGVIEFICFLFALFLIIRLCRSPRSRSYD